MWAALTVSQYGTSFDAKCAGERAFFVLLLEGNASQIAVSKAEQRSPQPSGICSLPFVAETFPEIKRSSLKRRKRFLYTLQTNETLVVMDNRRCSRR